MDRLEFIGSIDHGDFVSSQDAIIQFFDHTMAAYNLIGECRDIEVLSNINSSISMTFKIIFTQPIQSETMANKITTDFANKMNLYGKLFNINPTVSGNILDIQILHKNNNPDGN